MKKLISEKGVILLLFAGGLFFFSLSFINLSDTDNTASEELSITTHETWVVLKGVDIKLNLISQENPSSFNLLEGNDSEKKVLALYIMPASPCSNCINEASEYIEVINGDEFLSDKIEQTVWFHGEDEVYARQFSLVSDLQINKVYSLESSLPMDMIRFDERIYSNQLVLIDKERQAIFYRILLPKGVMTPKQEKKAIFAQIFE